MKIGNLQIRWQAKQPVVYDKETRIVCLNIKSETQKDDNGEERQGYSFIPVEIDRQIDYGHIKSQLIESGFAQKDEFGLLMNAVEGILTAVSKSNSWETFKQALDTEDINAFSDFCEFRKMCADAAKEVMNQY